jgi:hypothetical protein
MMKNLALTASIIALVSISGQAFAQATGSNVQYWPEATNSSVHTHNGFDQAMVAQAGEPDAYRYHGGPKSND